jgi:[acyl-carrier-protein] S-malonyltransferase
MHKTAFLFPGQGSQNVGMGEEFFREFDFVRETFDMAEELTRTPIARLCFKGPMEELTRTVNLQPAVTAVNLACLKVIRHHGVDFGFCAGHSLGEYSALAAAEVLTPEDTVRVVFKRGELMHREADKYEGAMHAIVGLPIETVQELVDRNQDSGPVAVANHNTASQIVITGAPAPVERLSAKAVELGARAIPLKVSGAWHSELMRGAEAEFTDCLSAVRFEEPRRTVVFNATGGPLADPEEIRSVMARQLCSPVRWYDAVMKLLDEPVETFVEVGPGRVLTGLLKKIVPEDRVVGSYNVSNMKQLEKLLRETT